MSWLSRGFTVNANRSQPKQLEVYVWGLCPAVVMADDDDDDLFIERNPSLREAWLELTRLF